MPTSSSPSDPKLGVWMAWQAWRDGQADIHLAAVEGPSGGAPYRVTNAPGNEWSPSLAIAADGRAFVAFDTYRAGNYDVILSEIRLGAEASEGFQIPIADTARYEARPVVAVDPRGRAWVAYEERDADWGKDAENLVDGKGSSLYRSAAVRVRCVDGRRVLAPSDPIDAMADGLRMRNSFPRLAVDRSGRVWLAFRHREEAVWGANAVMVVGGVWTEYVTSLAGKTWTPPQPVSRSDGLLDNRPAIVVPREGPPLMFYATDGRLRREIEFNPELRRRYWAHSGTPGNPNGSFNWDVEVAALVPTRADVRVDPEVAEAKDATISRPPREGSLVHPDEAADVARMRRLPDRGRRQDLSPDARRLPPPHRDLAGRRLRRRPRGHVALRHRRRRPRLDGQRRPRQRRRQGIHLVARPEDDRPLSQPAPRS